MVRGKPVGSVSLARTARVRGVPTGVAAASAMATGGCVTGVTVTVTGAVLEARWPVVMVRGRPVGSVSLARTARVTGVPTGVEATAATARGTGTVSVLDGLLSVP